MKVLVLNLNKKEQDFLFMSDLHLGHRNSDIPKIKKDLEEAKKRNCRIIINGDIFDSIIPKDPRYMASYVDLELVKHTNILDKMIDFGEKILSPYAKYIDIISDGNHEWEINRRYGTNLIIRLIERLNMKYGGNIQYGGYMYYACYKFTSNKTSRGGIKYLNILGHHGFGGSAPVSKGMIDVARIREAGWIYDIFIFSHKHNGWAKRSGFVKPIVENTNNPRIRFDPLRDIQTGKYLKAVILDNSVEAPDWQEKKGFGYIESGGVFCKVKLVFDNYRRFDIKVEI